MQEVVQGSLLPERSMGKQLDQGRKEIALRQRAERQADRLDERVNGDPEQRAQAFHMRVTGGLLVVLPPGDGGGRDVHPPSELLLSHSSTAGVADEFTVRHTGDATKKFPKFRV